MKLLEKVFISGVGGFSSNPLTYTQIIRKNQFAVYERSLNNKIKDWEVIYIKMVPKGTDLFGAISTEDTEFYPSTGQWGKHGFSFHGKYGKEAALNKFKLLTKEKHAPEIKSDIKIPPKEFTTNGLAKLNNINYTNAAKFIKEQISLGKIKFLREENKNSKGKASKIYEII